MVLLFLNSIGTSEVIFILFIVLMLFGSKSIPGLARGLGKGMREIRNASDEIRRDIQNSALEMRKDLRIDQTIDDLKKSGKIEDEPPKQEKAEETETRSNS